MKFTLSWLREHLETEAPAAEIGRALTSLGLELESLEDRAAALRPFTIARVLSAERHPDADRLQVCRVQTAGGEVQVVCGAPNARAGLVGVFAPPGTHIPGTGIDLTAGVIRGVASNGMLLSERELGLSEAHEGIVELPEDAPLGASWATWAGLDDPLFDIAITPDRADCTGVRGIARDLAAAGLGRLRPLDETPVPGRFESPVRVRLDLPDEAAGACPLFVGRLIRGVRNGPSPRWLRDRLAAVGLRPISALVDITNFFTFDRARPLHVFDAGRLTGDLTVRLSRPGEELAALDDRTYRLEDGTVTVIADDAGPQSLGGVIGGAATGCTAETVDVFVECALFDPIRTAATGRRLGIDSDARYRFERGVDPAAVFSGMEQATAMILSLCGGEASGLVVAGEVPDWQRTIRLRASRVAALGGLDVPAEEQARLLVALGCAVAEDADGPLTVQPPSWRGDIEGEADLVEEVLRVSGYDRIPAVSLPRTGAIPRPAVGPALRSAGLVRRVLASRGLEEAVTWSFLDSRHAELFGGGREDLRIVNPIASDLDAMRPSILPNLIAAAGRNAARGWPDAALFEIGPVYRDATPAGQSRVAAGVRAGRTGPRHWKAAPRVADAFDAKADALAGLEAAGAPVANLQATADAPAWYHPGRSGCLRLGPIVLARFGELHPGILAELEAGGPIAAFELLLDAIPAPKARKGAERRPLALSSFQPVERDFAFVVPEAVTAERLLRAVRGGDKALIADVGLFDVYRGPGVPDGHKSLAVWVRLQPSQATLTEQQIAAVSAAIAASVTKQTGGTLRG